MIQDPPVLSSRERIDDLVRFAGDRRIDTLFIQVYRENRSWFASGLADDTPYRTCLQAVGEDPLKLLIRTAHANGIQVHAWVNLLSLGANRRAPFLDRYGPEILTRNTLPKKDLEDYRIDNQFFLEPGDPRVRRDLSKIIETLLAAYPELDGIQFDYIRYPDTRPAYGHTSVNEALFKKATGSVSVREEDPRWQAWKRGRVTGLLRTLAKRSRLLRPEIQVSTTGLTRYSRAYYESFQDWRTWLSEGVVDFVTLMSYVPTVDEFDRYLQDARRYVPDPQRANIAVGAYKLTDTPGVFDAQWNACEEAGFKGCAVFHYGSVMDRKDWGLDPGPA